MMLIYSQLSISNGNRFNGAGEKSLTLLHLKTNYIYLCLCVLFCDLNKVNDKT